MWLLVLLVALITAPAAAEDPAVILFAPGESLEIVRRFNYSTRIDGRYGGHVQREERVSLRGRGAATSGASADGTLLGSGSGSPSGPAAVSTTLRDRPFRGELWSSTSTVRNLATVASQVDRRSGVRMDWVRGRLEQVAGERSWEGLPTIPPVGERVPDALQWESPALVGMVLPGGDRVHIPTMAVYRIDGFERYQGRDVVRVTYGYRLVWPQSASSVELHEYGRNLDFDELPPGDFTIRANRQGYMLMPAGAGVPLLQRTEINDQFQSPRGREERSGFLLTWYTGPPPPVGLTARVRPGGEPEPDAGVATARDPSPDVRAPGPPASRGFSSALPGNEPAIVNDAPDIEDVEVDRDELNRVRLSIRNLQFVADQATLLPGEAGRLEQIADYLRELSDMTILVTGHTADVGTTESQQELSVERAETIVEAMIARGVPPGRFRYEGRGGREPVGDNSTPEGRAANRRVEIRLIP